MAARIARHPSVLTQFSESLAEREIVSREEADRLVEQMHAALRAAHERLKESIAASAPSAPRDERVPFEAAGEVATAVPADRLRSLNERLLAVPEGFTIHPKLLRQLERRLDALEEGGIDWGQAEGLAFGSLVVEGIPVRLTGQDTERGTFSHRHLVLHDAENGQRWTPIQRLRRDRFVRSLQLAAVRVCVRRLRVRATRCAADARAVGGAVRGLRQRRPDRDRPVRLQRSREVGQTSRLTLLLPQVRGNGPEHSSAC
jgi:2-oxoglutarate dehydrogenase E1 component